MEGTIDLLAEISAGPNIIGARYQILKFYNICQHIIYLPNCFLILSLTPLINIFCLSIFKHTICLFIFNFTFSVLIPSHKPLLSHVTYLYRFEDSCTLLKVHTAIKFCFFNKIKCVVPDPFTQTSEIEWEQLKLQHRSPRHPPSCSLRT